MSGEHDDAADDLAMAGSVATELVRLVRLIERSREQYQAEHPDAVDRATYHLLVALVQDGPARAGALADAVHSDPSTISRQIGQLVRLGLVERAADPQDGRAALLMASAEGERVFHENRRLRNLHVGRVLAGWSVTDRQDLARLLNRFTTDLAQERARPAPTKDRAPGPSAR